MVKDKRGLSITKRAKIFAANEQHKPTPATIEQHNKATFDDTDKAILNLVLKQSAITDKEAGKLVGLSREAVNRRRQQPLFVAALDRIRTAQQKSAVELLQDAVPVCVQVLVQIAKDKQANESARVSAAKAILDKTLPTKMENLLKGAVATTSENKGNGTIEELYNGLNGKDKKQFLATITAMLNHKRP